MPIPFWQCRSCGFVCAWFYAGLDFPYCVPCQEQALAPELAARRAAAKLDAERNEVARRAERRAAGRLISCEITYIQLENDDERLIDSVSVQCGKCQHETSSYGRGEGSVKRCLALLRAECPLGEINYYEIDDDF